MRIDEKEIGTNVKTIKIYSQNIEMEFEIEICALLIMKGRKRNSKRNRTTKSGKNQNTCGKNVGSIHYQTNGYEGKK